MQFVVDLFVGVADVFLKFLPLEAKLLGPHHLLTRWRAGCFFLLASWLLVPLSLNLGSSFNPAASWFLVPLSLRLRSSQRSAAVAPPGSEIDQLITFALLFLSKIWKSPLNYKLSPVLHVSLVLT